MKKFAALLLVVASAVSCVVTARERLDSAVRVGWQVLMAEIGDDPRIVDDPVVSAVVARVHEVIMNGGVVVAPDVEELGAVLRGVIDSRYGAGGRKPDAAMKALLDGLLSEILREFA